MEKCILFCCLGTTDKNKTELHSRQRHSDCRTEAACDGRPNHVGLGFRHANTFWKAPGVYIHMHQTSSTYHVGAGQNHYFGAEIFFYQQCCDTLFWLIGPCIILSPIRTCPRVRAWSSLLEVILPHLQNLAAVIRNTQVLLIRFSSCYFSQQHAVG
jgi:hypothetical protein